MLNRTGLKFILSELPAHGYMNSSAPATVTHALIHAGVREPRSSHSVSHVMIVLPASFHKIIKWIIHRVTVCGISTLNPCSKSQSLGLQISKIFTNKAPHTAFVTLMIPFHELFYVFHLFLCSFNVDHLISSSDSPSHLLQLTLSPETHKCRRLWDVKLSFHVVNVCFFVCLFFM